jgi:hypothetical protein
MTRKYHTMSIEDREMFAYNAAYNKSKAEIARINAHPEQRMKYCFSFMQGADTETAQLDYSEAHY